MPVTLTNADTIVTCIKDVLLRINLRIQDALGSTMMDIRPSHWTKNEVAAQTRH